MPRHSIPLVRDRDSHDESSRLSDEMLARYARLLAAGEISWPRELDAEQRQQVVVWAREHRRRQLVALVASRIADEMLAERSDHGGSFHD